MSHILVTIAVLASSMLVGCSPEQKPFSFRTFNQSASLMKAKSARTVSACHVENSSTTCVMEGGPIAGASYAEQTVDFYEGKFEGIHSQFPAENLSDVRNNLMAAYGPSCGREVGYADTPSGPLLVNDREFWCFREGRLALEHFAYGIIGTTALVEFPYVSRDKPKAASPSDL